MHESIQSNTHQVLQRMVELNWGFIILHPHFLLFLNNLLLDVSGSTGRNKYRPTGGNFFQNTQ